MKNWIKILMVVVILTTIGCAAQPPEGATPEEIEVWEKEQDIKREERKYEREDKKLRDLDTFYEYEASCKRAGGFIAVVRRSHYPWRCNYTACPPKNGDRYSCVTRVLR